MDRARLGQINRSAADAIAASASAPWVWTHSLMRNMDGDVVCRGAHIFAASLRQATKTFVQ